MEEDFSDLIENKNFPKFIQLFLKAKRLKLRINFRNLKSNLRDFYIYLKSFARDILSKPTNYLMHLTVIGLSFFVSISTVYGNNSSLETLVPKTSKITDRIISPRVNPKTIAAIAEVTNAPVKINEEVLENNLPSITSSLAFVDDNSIESQNISLDFEEGRKDIIIYKVENGDTLWSIAKKFDITTNTIKWANNLENPDSIKPDQNLTILPISGTLHKVRPGETVEKIASIYNASVPQIIEENGLINEEVSEDQVLIIPGGTKAEPKPSLKPNSSPVNNKGNKQHVARFASGPKDFVEWLIRPTIGQRTQGIHANNGVDIANTSMPPVWAAASGVVTFAGWDGAYGLTVKIRHSNGVETQYSHLNKIYVYGGPVGQGQIIGQMGRTGRVYGRTGIHLHFEVHGARNPF